MQIHELQNTATAADLTGDNYFVMDGVGGSKKVPADFAKLQKINPATDTQAEIWDKISSYSGDVVVGIPSVGTAVEVEMYQLAYTKIENNVYTARFETTRGGLIKVATCVLNDVSASTLGNWTYETKSTVDELPAIMTSLQPGNIGNAELLAKDKTTGEVVKVDGNSVAKASDVAEIKEFSYNSAEGIFENLLETSSFVFGYLNEDGSIGTSTQNKTQVSPLIQLNAGDAIQFELRTSNTSQMVLVSYNTDKQKISAIPGLGNDGDSPLFGTFVAENVCFVRICKRVDGIQSAYIIRANEKEIAKNSSVVPSILSSVEGISHLVTTWEIGSVSNTTGAEGATDKRIRSGYIDVKKGDVFKFEHCYGQIIYFDYFKLFSGSLFSGVSLMPDSWESPFDGFIRIILSFDITNGTSIVVNPKDVSLLSSRAYKVLPQKCYEPKERNSFESLIEQKALEVSRIEGVKFGFITDLHYHNSDVNTSDMSGQAANIGRYFNYTHVPDYVDAIVSLGNKTRMDALVCGGDTIWGTLSPSESSKLLFSVNKAFEKFDGERFILAGNHDFCDDYFSKQANPTLADCFKPYELANLYRQNKLYGYKDCDGVRAFFLNSSDTFIIEGNTKKYSRKSTFGFSAEQLNWFASALASTPHGYHVIVFVHYNPDKITTNGNVITSLLKHFVARDSGTKTAGTGDFAVSIDYDFTQCSNNAVIGVVSGHTHADSLTKNTSNINQLVTTTTTLFEAGSLTRTYGTDTELAFDVININKAERKVKVIRVGAGSDREFTY